MKVIVANNNKLIESHNKSVKVVDKYIRMERIVPQIVEKIVNVEVIVEKELITEPDLKVLAVLKSTDDKDETPGPAATELTPKE